MACRSPSAWNALNRARTVKFTFGGKPDLDAFVDFLYEKLGKNCILTFQFMGGFVYNFTFFNEEFVAKLEGCSPLVFQGKPLPFSRLSQPTRYVVLRHVPPEASKEMIQYEMAAYGKIKKFEYTDGLTKHAEIRGMNVKLQMVMEKPVPNYLQWGPYRIIASWAGMQRVCGRCAQAGHFAAACPSVRCANCGENGHMAARCEGKCRRCEEDHPRKECQNVPRTFAEVTSNTSLGSHMADAIQAMEISDKVEDGQPREKASSEANSEVTQTVNDEKIEEVTSPTLPPAPQPQEAHEIIEVTPDIVYIASNDEEVEETPEIEAVPSCSGSSEISVECSTSETAYAIAFPAIDSIRTTHSRSNSPGREYQQEQVPAVQIHRKMSHPRFINMKREKSDEGIGKPQRPTKSSKKH